MDNFEAEILQTFLDESLESLGAWEQSCLALGQVDDSKAVSQLFRCAHNMKGSAKSVGLSALGAFIHVVEDLILKLKNGDAKATPAVVGFLLDCEAFLRGWLEGLRLDRTLVLDTTPSLERIAGLDSLSDNPNSSQSLAVPAQQGFIIFQDDAPTVSKQKSVTLNTPVKTKPATENIRVPAVRIDELIQLVGELSIQASIISHARVNGSLALEVSQGAIELLSKITRELQTRSLEFRMQSLQSTIQRLERVARDVATELNKVVEVLIEGLDVELDKTIIEQMMDPLVHMVRNAIDHGVESVAERNSSGKPAKARVSFIARQEPDRVVLTISDDGRGLDAARIRSKAEKQGLVAQNASLSQNEIFALIFLQGFSTSETVTNISGRGVGMEVVHKAVTDIGGQVIIESKLGVGTSFHISLPSSVSILEALVVYVDGQRYAVPIGQVEEVLNPHDVRIETATDRRDVFNLREDIVPLHDLRNFLQISAALRTQRKVDRPPPGIILIIRYLGRRMGLSIDSIAGQQQVVVRKLSGALVGQAGFVGGTILGDGEPGFIIDIPFWAERCSKESIGVAQQ
jgi:two-component system chemotaxis sensor kinase CheA